MATSITLLTTTFYRSMDETRFHLACQLIGNAVGAGHRILVVDGSPDPQIAAALRKIGADVRTQIAKGMGGSRRELFGHATHDPDGICLWIEPEKVDFVRLIQSVIAPIESGAADIVIPARTAKSFSSYPPFQVKSEKAANADFCKATNMELDMMFGPMAFTSKVLPHFALCNPADRFGTSDTYIQHIAAMIAMSEGARVDTVPVDFYYPPSQKAEEEVALSDTMRGKRMHQFEDCTHGFRVVAKKLGLLKKS